MREVIRQVRTGLLIRVDSYKKIKNCYKTKTLTFGCAANWIDYALKKNNEAIGDIFECIFAHLPINDNRIYVCDKNGRPIGENLWILCDENSQTCFLRFIPAILTPLICFYNVLPQKELVDNEYEIIDLDKYKTAMGYIKDTVGYLIIDDIKSLIGKLRV